MDLILAELWASHYGAFIGIIRVTDDGAVTLVESGGVAGSFRGIARGSETVGTSGLLAQDQSS